MFRHWSTTQLLALLSRSHQGSVSGNYSGVSIAGAQSSVSSSMNNLQQIVDAIDEVNMILAFLNSSIDLGNIFLSSRNSI